MITIQLIIVIIVSPVIINWPSNNSKFSILTTEENDFVFEPKISNAKFWRK
jgi:hypothetical protein